MKCKICGREMTRERRGAGGDTWTCRNPRCPAGGKKEGTKNGT